MRQILFSLTFLLLFINGRSQSPDSSNYSPGLDEINEFYINLGKKYSSNCGYLTMGNGDAGRSIALFSITNKSKAGEGKLRLLINNGIHPGEPDGINACMKFCRELLSNPKKYKSILDNIDIYVIPVYNVDGCLRRSSTVRANQNGPAEYGFRGNYSNLDLNRDFIKSDSKNAITFAQIFHFVKPHLLIDTHVSNGADYEYTFTYFFTQVDKLPLKMRSVVKILDDDFSKKMKEKKCEPFPYVNHHGEGQVSSLAAFNDSPRYCTGYAALFNCIGLTTETHMLKPFDNRVKATLLSIEALCEASILQKKEILAAYTDHTFPDDLIPVATEIDSTIKNTLQFKGFHAGYKTSNVTGLNQLYYDRKQPELLDIDFYPKYKTITTFKLPKYFLIPQSQTKVIERLNANKILLYEISRDTFVRVKFDVVSEFDAPKVPYEGHYLHNKIAYANTETVKFFVRGDFLVKVNEENKVFLANVFCPGATDSYFRWNFFDANMQQKEWFSDYVFDSLAEELIRTDEDLRRKFEKKKMMDSEFSRDRWAQLYFVYKNSKYYEQTAYEIPVYRIDE